MKTRWLPLLISTFIFTGVALGQIPAKTGERLLYLRWEKWSPLNDEIAKRCLLVETSGHFRFELTTEAMGGGGGEKAFEGQLSPEDLAALKTLVSSPDFNHMKVPPPKSASGTRTIHFEAEMVDYSSPEDELPPISIDSIDGDVAIPKQLRQLSDWMKKVEKMKSQQLKGPMQMCGRTERSLMLGDEDHRIDEPLKKK